jgi:hypothetical protein
MGLRGDLNAELAEVTEKRAEKHGTMGSGPENGSVGNVTSMWNGSTGYVECQLLL